MLYENHWKCVKIDRGDLDMEKYGLHDRQRRLLYLLNCEHGMITGKDLALSWGFPSGQCAMILHKLMKRWPSINWRSLRSVEKAML